MEARFSLKRRLGYHMARTYIPTATCVVLSWISVWLPEEFVSGRIFGSLTLFLTLSAECSAAKEVLPRVSYMKVKDFFENFSDYSTKSYIFSLKILSFCWFVQNFRCLNYSTYQNHYSTIFSITSIIYHCYLYCCNYHYCYCSSLLKHYYDLLLSKVYTPHQNDRIHNNDYYNAVVVAIITAVIIQLKLSSPNITFGKLMFSSVSTFTIVKPA